MSYPQMLINEDLRKVCQLAGQALAANGWGTNLSVKAIDNPDTPTQFVATAELQFFHNGEQRPAEDFYQAMREEIRRVLDQESKKV